MFGIPPPSLYQFIDYIRADPLATLQFLVPSLMVVFYAILLKISGARNKVDRNPDLKQEKEVFRVPGDYLNKEMVYVEKSDIEHVSDIILKSSSKVNIITKRIRHEYRKYRRIKYRMTFVQSERRKASLRKQLNSIADNMLKEYTEIRKSMLDVGDGNSVEGV
ncbi:MAG: hypothetical protein M1496_05385 [Candidatus Thermoplasmatota archaeon]|nr:hypothetical protein [Candidatus Thermoplasmatota archaeon]